MSFSEPAVHRIAWRLDAQSDPSASVTCEAPPDHWCRVWCAEGCDERCPGPDEHRHEPTGRCAVVDGIFSMGTAGELYEGGEHPASDGPIRVDWQSSDECYVWRYEDEKQEARA